MSATEVAADLRAAVMEISPVDRDRETEQGRVWAAVANRLEALADDWPKIQAVLDAAVAWYEASITEDVWDYELHDAVRVYREGQ